MLELQPFTKVVLELQPFTKVVLELQLDPDLVNRVVGWLEQEQTGGKVGGGVAACVCPYGRYIVTTTILKRVLVVAGLGEGALQLQRRGGLVA